MEKRIQLPAPRFVNSSCRKLGEDTGWGMNKEQTQKYFDTLEKVKALCARLNGEEELAPSLLYNLDEAGVDQVSEMDGDRQVVVLKIKTTPTYRKTSADRTHLSAAVCVAGDGWKAKTMYALK